MFFDPMWLLLMIPGLALSGWASWRTKSSFKKYSKVRPMNGMTGAQAAKLLLDRAGIYDVEVVQTKGFLSDHYNPVNKTLALSGPVYGQSTVSAIGVACHEAGHAIQHAKQYAPLWARSALVPTANIGSKVGYYGMFLGLILMGVAGAAIGKTVVLIGAILFSAMLLFQLITLPVEFDASARAKKLAAEHGILAGPEQVGMNKVLNAAALTYVAAAFSTLMTLVYFLMRAGFLGSRD